MESYVYAHRGSEIENRHRVSLAVVNREGRLLAAGGDPRLLAHLRSSAKPFQAQALFQSGAMRRFGFGPEELALAMASHDGTPAHTEIAARMLERIGLDPSYLACGVHPPPSLARPGGSSRPITKNPPCCTITARASTPGCWR